MAIKFAQKTGDTKTPPADKVSVKTKAPETAKAATPEVNATDGGADLFENRSGTQKRKKKR
ncbi:hypothetical protein PMI41_00847 [Phyllobacterium sp. YR531]|nr:hypothetical protein PMI41_00847 [Phyllobacterium sp. YR531]